MNDQELEIQALKGQILILEKQVDWWRDHQDFWACKYMRDHPEITSARYRLTAFKDETGASDPPF